MKLKWLILGLAGLVAIAAWATMVVTYFFHPTLALWTAEATVAAFATEGFLWVCAGVFGFSFLAKRRQMLTKLRRRLFGTPSQRHAATEQRRP